MESVSPIPLSIQWLEGFGFISGKGQRYRSDNIWVLQPELENIQYSAFEFPEGEWVIERGFISHSIEIRSVKYVHQLQNLYHSLTDFDLLLK